MAHLPNNALSQIASFSSDEQTQQSTERKMHPRAAAHYLCTKQHEAGHIYTYSYAGPYCSAPLVCACERIIRRRIRDAVRSRAPTLPTLKSLCWLRLDTADIAWYRQSGIE